MADKNNIVDDRKLYAYRRASEKDCTDFAMMAELDRDGLRFLSPPNYPHSIPGKLEKETEDGFIFRAAAGSFDPGLWEFVEVTFENFRDKYHKLCIDGGREVLGLVKNTQELVDLYYERFPDY